MVVGGRELIDTLWNVNYGSTSRFLTLSAELIDTLWNVNYEKKNPGHYLNTELIDTLWNVNSISSGTRPKKFPN